MLMCTIRNNVIKADTCHRYLSFNRNAHWYHRHSTEFAGQTWDDIPTGLPGSQWTAAMGSCSLETARTRTPSLVHNLFCLDITLSVLQTLLAA